MVIEIDILNEEFQGQSTILDLCSAMKQLSVSMSDAKAAIKEYLVYNRRRDTEIESMLATVEYEWMERNPGHVTDKWPIVSALIQDYQDRLVRGETPDAAFHSSGLASVLAPAILGGSDAGLGKEVG